MEPQVELLDLIVKVMKEECNISICLDGLPKSGGISAELAGGHNVSLYYSKNAIKNIPVLFLCKSKDQKACVNALSLVCNYLQGLKAYPRGNGFSWLDATTATEPGKVGRQEDGQYIYSAVVNMKIYM